MLISRRTLIVATLVGGLGLTLPRTARAGGMLFKKDNIPDGQAPGDYGCGHELYHPYYKVLFGNSGHCTCGDGDCRVTDWRKTELGSPLGYDVIAYRRWLPLPQDVWIPPPEAVPPILRVDRAHICAYDQGFGVAIPCAIINATQS